MRPAKPLHRKASNAAAPDESVDSLSREEALAEGRKTLRAAVMATIASGVFGVVLALVLSYGARAAAGVATGTLIIVVNLLILARIGRALTDGQGGGLWGLVYMIKLFGLLAVVWLVLSSGLVSGFGLAFGLVTLVPGIVIGALRASMPSQSLSSSVTSRDLSHEGH